VADLAQQKSRELSSQAGPIEERQAWLQFQSFVDEGMERYSLSAPAADILPLDSFQSTDEKQLETLTRVASKASNMIYDYLQHIVFPMKNGPMWFEDRKLQASGIDVGGNMIFNLVLGFSGTPSGLLPTSLGKCEFEYGSEAKIVKVLTTPHLICPLYPDKPDNTLCKTIFTSKDSWSVSDVLLGIASANPPYHALIDTGALITGYSNEEVARFMLEHGLKHCSACVFIDANNEQKAVVRSVSGLQAKAIPIQQCGVALSRRFVFFDMIHTTGLLSY
jgi:hypothetical protein